MAWRTTNFRKNPYTLPRLNLSVFFKELKENKQHFAFREDWKVKKYKIFILISANCYGTALTL